MMKPHEKPSFLFFQHLEHMEANGGCRQPNIESEGHQYLDDRLSTLFWQDPRKILKNQDCKITLWLCQNSY